MEENLNQRMPPDEFVDAVLAFSALMTFQDALLARPEIQEDSEESQLFLKMVARFRMIAGTFDIGLRTYGVAMADAVRQKTRFVTALTGRLLMNPDFRVPSEIAEKRFSALVNLATMVFRRVGIADEILSDARAVSVFRKVSHALTIEDDVARLAALGRIPGSSGLASSFLPLIDKACKLAGVEPSRIETELKEAATATSLGEDLRRVEAALMSVDSGDPTVATLAADRADKVAAIENLALTASNPGLVSTMVASAVTKTDGYATLVGKEQSLSTAQEMGVLARGKTILAAGAGSGKTKVMAAKVVYHIKELGFPPQSIIATSFSRKSARELTDRVKKYGGESILQGRDNGFGTSHSVAGRIVNKFGKEAGLGNQVQLDSGDMTKLVRIAMEQVKMFGSGGQAPNPNDDLLDMKGREVRDAVAPMELGAYAEGLNRAVDSIQRKFDSEPANYRLKFMLTTLRRILDEGRTEDQLSPQEKLLVTQALTEAGVTSKLASVRKAAEEELSGPKVVALGAESNKFYKEAARQWFNIGAGVDDGNGKKSLMDAEGRPIGARRFQTFISKNKGRLNAPGAVAAPAIKAYQDALAQRGAMKAEEFNAIAEPAIFAAVYGAYEWLKKNAVSGNFDGGSDFDDVLLNCCKVLLHSDKARSTINKFIKCVIIDEAQDSNPCQNLLYGLWAGAVDPATRKPWPDGRMTADTYIKVGDDKQAIYEFRGATPEIFIGDSDANGGEFKTLYLDTNYRSGSAIVESANKIAGHITNAIPMVCKAYSASGDGSIKAMSIEDNEASAILFADDIVKACRGDLATNEYRDFGLGVRTNAEAMAYGVELLKRGVPFKSKLNFFNTPTAKAMIDWLKIATMPLGAKGAFNDCFLRAHKAPNFMLDKFFVDRVMSMGRNQNYYEWLMGGGWKTIYTGNQEWRNKNVRQYMDAITYLRKEAASTKTAADMVETILKVPGSPVKGVQTSMLDALIEEVKGSPEAMDILVQEAEGGKITEDDIKTFALAPLEPLLGIAKETQDVNACVKYVDDLRRINETKAHDENSDANAVIIDTAHGWKGLECKHMYVPMVDGTFPHNRSKGSEAEMNSERRLAYVAITRGRESVTVLCPRKNLMGKPAKPSQFVEEGCIPLLGGPKTGKEDDAAEREVMMLKSRHSSLRTGSLTDDDIQALASNDVEYLQNRLAEIEIASAWENV